VITPAPSRVRLREVPAVDAEIAAVRALDIADQPLLAGKEQRGKPFSPFDVGGSAQQVCLRTVQQRSGGHLRARAADGDVLALLGLRAQPVRSAAGIACRQTFTRR
jgi:hypothetical protein